MVFAAQGEDGPEIVPATIPVDQIDPRLLRRTLICQLYGAGVPIPVLSAVFGVHTSTVYRDLDAIEPDIAARLISSLN